MIKGQKVKVGWDAIRVSTPDQGRVQHGSLEQQSNRSKRWLTQVSEETGVEYRIVRTIAEKRSGKKSSFHLRKEFQELIHAIERRQIDFVVFENVSRMGRWARKNLEVIEIAAENGVEVWFINSGRYNHFNKGDRIKFGIDNLMAEEESKENTERVTTKQREAMVANGKDVATVPINSLDPHPTRVGIYVINTKETVEVIDVLKKFCELKSFKLLVGYCSSKNYRTKERLTKETVDEHGNRVPPRKVGGDLFDEKALHALLTSPKLRGFNTFIDTYDQFPKIRDENKVVRWEYAHHREHGPHIPPELFVRVDETLALFKKHRPKVGKYKVVDVLKGILRDTEGNNFNAKSAKTNAYRYYYNCPKNPDLRLSIRADELEAAVIKRVKTYLRDSGTLAKVAKATLDNRLIGLPLIEEQIPAVQKEVRRREQVIAGYGQKLDDLALAHSAPDVVSAIAALNDGKNRAERDLQAKRDQLSDLIGQKDHIQKNIEHKTLEDFLDHAMKGFDKMDRLQQKLLIQAIIPEIVVHPGNKIELRLNPDPNGKASGAAASAPCHGGGRKVAVLENWRE